MSAGRLDIIIEQGSTFTRLITIQNSDLTPFDLSSWSARGQVRRRHRSDAIVASFTFVIDPDPTTGQLTITMDAATTGAISAGETVNDESSRYVWDFEIENSTTFEVRRILEGDALISQEVTRT
jgi:hypothetical protein